MGAAGRAISLIGGITCTGILIAGVIIGADAVRLTRSETKVLTFLRKNEYKRLVANVSGGRSVRSVVLS